MRLISSKFCHRAQREALCGDPCPDDKMDCFVGPKMPPRNDARAHVRSSYRDLLLPILLLAFLLPFSFCLFPSPLHAREAGEALADPALEARALALGDQLRCMVCQSESINDSPADLAKDLRLLVRDKLKGGLNDAAILDYVHERYGDYVLLKPPLHEGTALLWLAPWLILGAGAVAVMLFFVRQASESGTRKDDFD